MTNETGEQLAAHLKIDRLRHAESAICPGCDQSVMTVGLVHLAYTFRDCSCGNPEYPHLVEQLWHLACLQGRRPELDFAATRMLDVLDTYTTTTGKHAVAAREALRAALAERRSAA